VIGVLIEMKQVREGESEAEGEKSEVSAKMSNTSKISFFKNGKSMGVAFSDVKAEVLYPAVSLIAPSQVALISPNKPNDFDYV
jgi:hypothetical protein